MPSVRGNSQNPASDVARMATSIKLVPRENRNASSAQEAGNLEERPNTRPSAGFALSTGKP